MKIFNKEICPAKYLKALYLMAFVILIYFLHNNIPLDESPFLMVLLQKTLFLPVILCGFWYGLRGGMIMAVIVIFFYPHSHAGHGGHNPFFVTGQNADMVLLIIIGFVTGLLSDTIHKKNKLLEETAEQRDKANKELRESVEIIKEHERLAGIGEFSAVVAHEVRNPLYGMLGAVEIIEKKIDKGDKAYFCINTLKKEIERLKRLTGNFLLYASPKKPEYETLDIVEIVKGRSMMFSTTEKRKTIQFNFHGEAIPLKVRGNKDALEQVMQNLLNNASEAMSEAENPEINITFEKANEEVKLFITDNGKGMDEETVSEAFKPFFSKSEKGTGLGLSISRRIIEEHHGEILVKSAPEKGTTIEITLQQEK